MTEVHRVGDSNTAGAAITSSQNTSVYAGNKLIAVNGDPVAGHGLPPHASPTTANGNATVMINNIPVNSKNDADSCGHPRAAGLGTVFIGPK